MALARAGSNRADSLMRVRMFRLPSWLRRRRRRLRFGRRTAWMFLGVMALGVLGWVGVLYGPGLTDTIMLDLDPERSAVKAALEAPDMAELEAGYAQRDYKPIWLNHGRAAPEAEELLHQLSVSGEDDLDPARYGGTGLAARLNAVANATWAERAQTDLQLTKAFALYVEDLHTPLPAAHPVYTDPALLPPGRPGTAEVLALVDTSPSLGAAMRAATRMNPLYSAFHQAIVQNLAGDDAAGQRLMLINLERLRALPMNLGRRFVLVDVASARLWMFEGDQAVDSMKVIVGKPDEPTPMLAGVIRYAMFNPFWNVPPDLVQRVYAPRIRTNLASLAALRMDAWTDYTENAQKLDPTRVDWAGVQAGTATVGLRQRPGPDNSMGAVKFMLPNELGIYLHDTPNKTLFVKPVRTFSAGCVRVEDYRRLAQWLYQRADVGPKGDGPDQRVDLQRPVPVYITYLTAMPEAGHITLAKDVYGRDAALVEQRAAQAPPLVEHPPLKP
jgi:murein L,D-transpeptidase YcbB/YkuD